MTLPRPLTAALAAFLLAGAALPVLAQPTRPPAPASAEISPTERAAVLAAIAAELRRTYVFPDKIPAIVEHLDRSAKAGRYDLDDPRELADRISDDLRAASADGHLYLRYDPAGAAAGPPSQGEPDRRERQAAIRDHHGLSEARVLPGNIRYLKIAGFPWIGADTEGAYDAALRFLREGDAVIVDLRGNGGGAHEAVRYLVSHFLEPDRLLLTFLEGGRPPVRSTAVQNLPAGRLTGKPLYVLIDGGVASAGEDFAYAVQQFRLGELIGARTAGAANNNRLVPIAPGFMFSVSAGRPVHPVSRTNWEGVGVTPDLEADPAQALEIAQIRALRRLAQAPGAAPEALAEYAWARTGAEARLQPVSVSPARLEALVGRYGNAEVALRDGALWLVRPERRDARLTPMTLDGLFAVEGQDRLRVRLTGETLELLRMDAPVPRVLARA